MDRYFCFRFDVDTHRCIRRGVPRLIDLGARIDAPFTFFVHMGRAVQRRRLLPGRSAAGPQPDTAEKLSARNKLGAWDTLVAAVANPTVGEGAPDVLREVLAAGHEIGLHGGTNHAAWQADAHRWSPERVRDRVAAALATLEGITGEAPRGFASPGWNSPASLPGILEELGFRYLADLHGPGLHTVASVPGTDRLQVVRTAITAEPGGVAYLENLRARGLDDAAIRDDFRARLEQADRLAVVYDHPYFAGMQELSLVGELVEIARELGFRPVRLEEAIAGLGTPLQ